MFCLWCAHMQHNFIQYILWLRTATHYCKLARITRLTRFVRRCDGYICTYAIGVVFSACNRAC